MKAGDLEAAAVLLQAVRDVAAAPMPVVAKDAPVIAIETARAKQATVRARNDAAIRCKIVVVSGTTGANIVARCINRSEHHGD